MKFFILLHSALTHSACFKCLSLLSRLNGKHVVFGNVKEGMDVVKAMEAKGSEGGTTSAKIVIADCGQLN